MRSSLLAVAVAIGSMGVVLASQPAAAFGDRPDGRHVAYYPRHARVYVVEDPYAYRYIPRGYYPYYNGHYWRQVRIKRFRAHLPPYYPAWAAPKRGYRHVEWHEDHHGGHRRGDW